jgi:predicted helicase
MLVEKVFQMNTLDTVLQKYRDLSFSERDKGYRKYDRGKLIMACGTGKTFASLRIAENETEKTALCCFSCRP